MSDTKRKINKQTLYGKEFLSHNIKKLIQTIRVLLREGFFFNEKRVEWWAIKSKALFNKLGVYLVCTFSFCLLFFSHNFLFFKMSIEF